MTEPNLSIAALLIMSRAAISRKSGKERKDLQHLVVEYMADGLNTFDTHRDQDNTASSPTSTQRPPACDAAQLALLLPPQAPPPPQVHHPHPLSLHPHPLPPHLCTLDSSSRPHSKLAAPRAGRLILLSFQMAPSNPQSQRPDAPIRVR